MKVKEIGNKVRNFYYEHEQEISTVYTLICVTVIGTYWYKIGYRKGFYDGANTVGWVLFDKDPETYVKVTKMLQEAAKKK